MTEQQHHQKSVPIFTTKSDGESHKTPRSSSWDEEVSERAKFPSWQYSTVGGGTNDVIIVIISCHEWAAKGRKRSSQHTWLNIELIGQHSKATTSIKSIHPGRPAWIRPIRWRRRRRHRHCWMISEERTFTIMPHDIRQSSLMITSKPCQIYRNVE